MKRYTPKENEGELGEQDAAASPSGGGAASEYPTVTKWESGVSRGKANPVGTTKWESGLTRGKSNQIGVTKWESGTKRGKGNTLL